MVKKPLFLLILYLLLRGGYGIYDSSSEWHELRLSITAEEMFALFRTGNVIHEENISHLSSEEIKKHFYSRGFQIYLDILAELNEDELIG